MADGTDAMKYTDPSGAQAGFSTVGVPEISVNPVEYKEGIDTYKRKYPGAPTWSDTLSMNRGVMKSDTAFYDWIIGKVVKGEEYRADVTIYHFQRGDKLDFSKARLYKCFEAFPTRVKLAADLDAQSEDVGLQELDITYEYAELGAGS